MKNESIGVPEDAIRMYWWDGKLNFGDLIGPWLVGMITGRATVNTMWEDSDQSSSGLVTVGSLIHSLRRGGLDVWGTGSIRSLNAALVERLSHRAPRKIHAVRGWRTHKELSSKLGWSVPKVYGDPALLLPRFYEPRQNSDSRGRVAFVPHYYHKDGFGDLRSDFHVVDVERNPDVVVDEIASARACISTSLHGVIVAHAYGVPWTWLRISDLQLRGDTFKFEDFFTVMDRDTVSSVSLPKCSITERDLESAALHSSLPRNKFNFDSLLESFPSDAV